MKLLNYIMPIVTIIAIVVAIALYVEVTKLKQDPQVQIQKDTDELVAKVSKLISLPVDEKPTIATVSDPAALKDQTFFANAEKGDKVLIYTNAKKAILYSVSINKILDIAPLNFTSTATSTKATTENKPAAPSTTTATSTR